MVNRPIAIAGRDRRATCDKLCPNPCLATPHKALTRVNASDTHTAVAWNVAEKYHQSTGDDRAMVIVSTASPYKFNGSVLEALGETTAGMDEFQLLETLQDKNDAPIPEGLASLRAKPVLHHGVCRREEMEQAVLAFIRS